MKHPLGSKTLWKATNKNAKQLQKAWRPEALFPNGTKTIQFTYCKAASLGWKWPVQKGQSGESILTSHIVSFWFVKSQSPKVKTIVLKWVKMKVQIPEYCGLQTLRLYCTLQLHMAQCSMPVALYMHHILSYQAIWKLPGSFEDKNMSYVCNIKWPMASQYITNNFYII